MATVSRTTLLLSGGIDSMVCLSLLLGAEHRVEAIHVDYGQAAAEAERSAAESIAGAFRTPVRMITFDLGQQFGPGEIPFRNAALIFTAAMAGREHVDEIAIGIHAGVPYPDCSEDFLEAIKTTFRTSTHRRIGLVAPLKTWRKDEILAFAVAEHLPLHFTYSCEAGTIPPCGECQSCRDRSMLPC